jgi:hypothetical protein
LSPTIIIEIRQGKNGEHFLIKMAIDKFGKKVIVKFLAGRLGRLSFYFYLYLSVLISGASPCV